jgi:hypothetical protein
VEQPRKSADVGDATAVLYGDTVEVATARRCLWDTKKTGKLEEEAVLTEEG